MTRQAVALITSEENRDGLRLRTFGPLADLSGVDTSAPVRSVVLARRAREPRWDEDPFGLGPALAATDDAGWNAGPWNEGPWDGPLAGVEVATVERFAYGLIPVGAQLADGQANESTVGEDSVLVVDLPDPVHVTTLSFVAGAPRMTPGG